MTDTKRHSTSDFLSAMHERRKKGDGDTNLAPERAPVGSVAKSIAQFNQSLDAKLAAAQAEAQAARAEIADLRAQRNASQASVKIDPRRVRRSRFADRHAKAFEGPEFNAFVADIQSTGGNIQPGWVRPITDDPEHDYELASGHRRHAACLVSHLPFFALSTDMTDEELVTHMRTENRGRRDLSDFETGTQYARLLADGVFPSQRKMAASLGDPLRSVQRLLAFGDLSATVTSAFPDPRQIKQAWVPALLTAERDHPEQVAKAAAEMRASGNRPAHEVLQHITGANRVYSLVADDHEVLATRRRIHQRPAVILYRDAPDELLDAIEALVREYHHDHQVTRIESVEGGDQRDADRVTPPQAELASDADRVSRATK